VAQVVSIGTYPVPYQYYQGTAGYDQADVTLPFLSLLEVVANFLEVGFPETRVLGTSRIWVETVLRTGASDSVHEHIGNLQIIVLNKIMVCAPASYPQFLRDLVPVELGQQTWS
jgi:hypothetical protein